MSDSISRQAVKELAHKQIREKYCGMALKEQRDFYIKLADSIIDLLPSAEPQERKGMWINQGYNDEWYGPLYKCNLCGAETIGEDNFCPNCGCKMGVDNEQND